MWYQDLGVKLANMDDILGRGKRKEKKKTFLGIPDFEDKQPDKGNGYVDGKSLGTPRGKGST